HAARQAGRGKGYAAGESAQVSHSDGAGTVAALGNRQAARRIGEREASARRGSQQVDQAGRLRTAPAGDQIVAGHGRVTAGRAAGDVVEKVAVGRSPRSSLR